MITPEQAIDINFLRTNCKKIHWFGLGFIQVKLSDTQRVHVYTDKLPLTTAKEDIHNHRYDFNSQILKGMLSQELYRVVYDASGEFLRVQESCNPDNKVEARPTHADVEFNGIQNFGPGSSYSIDHKVFHRVQSSNAVTLITRTEYKKELADVVYHSSQVLTCPFSHKIDEETLWKIVEEALK